MGNRWFLYGLKHACELKCSDTTCKKRLQRRLTIILGLYMTSQKQKFQFLHLESQKNSNLTIDLLSLGIYDLPTPNFCGEFESELRSGFRDRNGELKGSGVSWYPRVFSGGFTESNSISARAGVAVPAGNRFGSVNPPKSTRGYQTVCGAGFRVRRTRIWS